MLAISSQFKVFVPAVVTVAAFGTILLAHEIDWRDWQFLLLFYVLLVVAYSVRIPNPRGGAITPSTVLSYLVIYLFNPPTALLVVGVGRTMGYIISRGWIPWRAFFNGALMALSVSIGSLVFNFLGGAPGKVEPTASYVALIAGPLAHIAANNFFVAFGLSRVRGTPFFNTWLNSTKELLVEDLIHIPTAVFLAILYTQVGHTAIAAYLVFLPFQWAAIRLYLKQRELYTQIVDGLVIATDANFPASRGHAHRVANLAVAIARDLRLSEVTVESIHFAALLHDVGLIGKDDLLDPVTGGATDSEELRAHVRVGSEIARELPAKEIARFILHHHERYDGGGYPAGLRGDAIPLGARIIGLAEAVDSMARGIFPYSRSLSKEDIRVHVEAEGGRAFSPEVVGAFLRLVEQGMVNLEATEVQEAGIRRVVRLGELPA